MRIVAIVNPRSGNRGTEAEWPALEAALVKSVGPVDVRFTQGVGHGIELARQAVLSGADQVVAVGGDGTLNEVVNGFFDKGERIGGPTLLSLIMRGTGGDFRKTFGWSKNPFDAIHRLAHGPVREIDVGRLTYTGHDGKTAVRIFDNIASMGMGGEVDMRVNASAAGKVVGGKGAYLWATARTLMLYENKCVRLKVDDHFDETLTTRIVAVCNGQFFGGGMWMAPKAKPDDGLFDVVILGDVSRWGMIKNNGRIYKGTHLELDKVRLVRGRKVVAESDEEVLLDVDGEAPGRLPATFEVLPKAIRLKG